MAYTPRNPFFWPLILGVMTGCQTTPKPNSVAVDTPSVIQRTGESVADALRIEPKVIKARDPTSLDYDPGPIKPSLHLSAASVMVSRGQLDEARSHYQSVLDVEPNNYTALIGSARLHHRQGAINEAIEAYQHAETVLGRDAVIHNDLALCLARSGRYPEAIQRLQAAVALKPESLMYRNNLAAVLVQAERPDDAVAVLASAHGPAVAHYNVGYLLNQQGNSAAATAHFVQALKANPSFSPARQMLNRVLPEVGRGQVEHIADRPSPVESSRSSSPVLRRLGDSPIHEASAVDVDSQRRANQPSDNSVQPAGFDEPMQEPIAVAEENPVDLSQLPDIRRPSLIRGPRGSGTSGFVPPSPAIR